MKIWERWQRLFKPLQTDAPSIEEPALADRCLYTIAEYEEHGTQRFVEGLGTGALETCDRIDSAINYFLDNGFSKLKKKEQVGFLRAVEVVDDVVFAVTKNAERWAGKRPPAKPFWTAEMSHGDMEGSYTHTWNSFDERA